MPPVRRNSHVDQQQRDEDYRRVDGDWKISRSEAEFHYVANHDEGWADQILAQLAEQ